MTRNSNIPQTRGLKSGAEIASRFGEALRQYQHTIKEETALTGVKYEQSGNRAGELIQAIPKRLRPYITPTHPFMDSILNEIQESFPIVVLSGPNRTGKSSLAASLAMAYGKPFRWYTAAGMLDEIKETWETKRPWKKPMTKLLIIDEIEKIVSSDWADTTIEHCITHRYDWELPTIVTTNLGADGFKQMASGRLSSRVKEQNTFYTIKSPWWK